MKFRVKMALCMTCLVSVLFGAGASVLLSISFDNSLQLEKENACNAYKLVLGSLKLVNAVKESPDYSDIAYTLDSFSDGNVGAWDALRLRTQDEIFYTDGHAPFETYAQDALAGVLITSCIQGEDGRRYLQLSTSFSAGPSTMLLDAAYEITPLFEAWHAQNSAYHRIFVILVAAAALVSYMVSYFLSAPLGRLSRAARAIASGDFSYRPHIRSGDEIGTLAADFNRMAQALEENIGELEAAMQRQENFMASFAHELKTPMTSIIGYADFIRSQTLSPEELSDAANYIFSEGRRLESLSLKLLDLLVLKKEKPQFQPASPAVLTRALAEHLEPVYRAAGIRLQCRCEEGVCLLEPDLYKSLLVNLMDNARKALSDAQSGNIYILVRMLPDGCRVQVTDNGRGIPPEALAHLTQAFYRVDKSRSRRAGGVGLGLALCSEIAQAHGGQISFESRMGNGTCVTVELRGGKA